MSAGRHWWTIAALSLGLFAVGCGDGAPSTPVDTGVPTEDVPGDGGGGDVPTDNAPTDTPTDGNPPVDTGAADAGDGGGTEDAGDSGVTDGGMDTGATDSGMTDGGGTDTGTADAGDGGRPDTGCVGELCPLDPRGHRGTSLVSAGGVMTSTGYRMISTLGQSSTHQGTMRSGSFRLRGGLIGATGGRR